MNDFSRNLAQEAYGMTPDDAWLKGICVRCKQKPEFRNVTEKKEYRISALCGPCWDAIMKEIDSEENNAVSED